MISYSKEYWGLFIFWRWYGSAVPRALPFSLLATLAAAMIKRYAPDPVIALEDPYPFQAFAFLAGFMIIFRTNLSYGRYWEGRTELQRFACKLTDVVVQANTYAEVAQDKEDDAATISHKHFRATLAHLVSLLHGVGLAILREDYNMDNLCFHDSLEAAPVANGREAEAAARQAAAGRLKHRKGSLPFRRSSASVSPKALSKSRASSDPPESPKERVASLPNRVLQSIKSFFGLFLLRTDYYQSTLLAARLKLPVIGGLSQDEGVALGAFTTSGAAHRPIVQEDAAVHGFFLDDGHYTPAPTERVQTIHAWVQNVLMTRTVDDGSWVSITVLASCHASLAEAMQSYEQCKKLNETQFPFPWAQSIAIVLVVFSVSMPFLVAVFVEDVLTAAITTFISVQLYIMLNEVANDIEDPFRYDPNQLPLPQMQYKLNERLLAVTRTERPVAFTDVSALEGPHNMPTSYLYKDEHQSTVSIVMDEHISIPTPAPASARQQHENRGLATEYHVQGYSSERPLSAGINDQLIERAEAWRLYPPSRWSSAGGFGGASAGQRHAERLSRNSVSASISQHLTANRSAMSTGDSFGTSPSRPSAARPATAYQAASRVWLGSYDQSKGGAAKLDRTTTTLVHNPLPHTGPPSSSTEASVRQASLWRGISRSPSSMHMRFPSRPIHSYTEESAATTTITPRPSASPRLPPLTPGSVEVSAAVSQRGTPSTPAKLAASALGPPALAEKVSGAALLSQAPATDIPGAVTPQSQHLPEHGSPAGVAKSVASAPAVAAGNHGHSRRSDPGTPAAYSPQSGGGYSQSSNVGFPQSMEADIPPEESSNFLGDPVPPVLLSSETGSTGVMSDPPQRHILRVPMPANTPRPLSSTTYTSTSNDAEDSARVSLTLVHTALQNARRPRTTG